METSVFTDLLQDRVDIIAGTKGSGKSALYRIFVEFLPKHLLLSRKVVIAHGVSSTGDHVFHAFKEQFETLDEEDFVSFWCIYLISLAHENFLKNEMYRVHLLAAQAEVAAFRSASQQAGIPELKKRKSLREVLAWTLATLHMIVPKVKFKLPENCGEFEIDLFGNSANQPSVSASDETNKLPLYTEKLKSCLDRILTACDLRLWMMIDRLDEIFPRRSELERRALRGLLRATRVFGSDRIRIKVFLRDDMLHQVVRGGEGFVALSHITSRQSEILRWSEEQILTMVVKRIFASYQMIDFFGVDKDALDTSHSYRTDLFYRVFPDSVNKGSRQSKTLRWIYNHTADSNGVVTPRDVIDLLTKAKQHQQSILQSNKAGKSLDFFDSNSIQYGLAELSKRKRTTYLEAEFPHLWEHMEKFAGGPVRFSEEHVRKYLGRDWSDVVKDLKSIGFLAESHSKTGRHFSIPYLYRKGLELPNWS